MFNLSRAMKAIDEVMGPQPSGIALTWNTPVQFDPDLIRHLVSLYDELNVRLEALVPRLARVDPAAGERAVLECANQLHRLRHLESLKLYPVISRGLTPDPIARRLFWQSRLVTLGLARRALRRFEELARAARNGSGTAAAAEHVDTAMADYRRRNESTIYPLYIAVGRRESAKTQAA